MLANGLSSLWYPLRAPAPGTPGLSHPGLRAPCPTVPREPPFPYSVLAQCARSRSRCGARKNGRDFFPHLLPPPDGARVEDAPWTAGDERNPLPITRTRPPGRSRRHGWRGAALTSSAPPGSQLPLCGARRMRLVTSPTLQQPPWCYPTTSPRSPHVTSPPAEGRPRDFRIPPPHISPFLPPQGRPASPHPPVGAATWGSLMDD